MIKLDATTKTIEVDLDGAVTTNQLPIYATYSDVNTSTFELSGTGSEDTATNDTTAVTAVSAPGSSTTRKVDLITVYNADTVAATVTVQLNNNTTLRTLVKETLQPGETLQYADGEGWSVPNKKKQIESTLNTTTSTLAGAGTYTGTGELNDYPDVKVSCYADVAGTLYFDFSVNGTDWRTYPTNGFSVAAGGHEPHVAVKGYRYFRVRYVNGSSAQSTFQLYTYYGTYNKLTSPINQSLGLDSDAILARVTDNQDEITRGLRSGVSQLNKFAYRTDVDTADGEALVIADNTTNTPTILTSASTFTVAYNNTTDGSSTTGALSLLFTYLDSNEDITTGTHTLGSTGSDTTSFSGLGINRVVVLSSGSANANTNDITITATTGGSVQAFIPAGDSVTQQLLFHIPSDAIGVSKYLFLNALKISGGGSPRVTFKIKVYNRGTATTYSVFRYEIDTSVENSRDFQDPCNFPFSARDVCWLTAETDTNNTGVSARLSLNIYSSV